MQSPPMVTIITPTHNREAFLAETIDSVLSQDYPTIEYIVLDDGSTDHTLELLERYQGKIRYESHPPNMGETLTVNKGFQISRGEIICVVNSDPCGRVRSVRPFMPCRSIRIGFLAGYSSRKMGKGTGAESLGPYVKVSRWIRKNTLRCWSLIPHRSIEIGIMAL